MPTFRARFFPAPASAGFALVAALMLCAGCNTTTYVLQVDAISQTGQAAAAPRAQEPRSFKIRPSNPRTEEDSLRYKEVSDYVTTALSGKGLYEAPSVESADLIIEIDYGMETPRMKYETVSNPVVVYRETAAMPDPIAIGGGSTNRRLLSTRVARAVGPQTRKGLELREETEVVIVYEKYLKVSARENHEAVEGRAPPEVWSVNVSAEDESQELRKYLPILASATADYIDTNTKQEKSVTINEGDGTVKFIRKGLQFQPPPT